MELNIEQALQQGVAAHNAGNLQEAERLYRAILEAQPKHPDANHNLGLIAVAVNQAGVALTLFKTALDVNPSIEQFWLSYVDTLVKNNELKDAKKAIKKAKKKGIDARKLETLLSQSKGVIDAKVPSQAQLNSLLEHYQNGRFGEAEKVALSIIGRFPKNQLSWKVFAAVLSQTGRNTEAAKANQTAVALSPQDAEAHNNLGNTLKELGRLQEAEASYKQAISLRRDFAAAHSNLGSTLQELGRLEEAKESCTQAIGLKPDFAEAHNNLGISVQKLGRLEEAKASFTQAIALKPDFAEACFNLGVILAINKDYGAALDIISKGNDIEPNIQKFILMLNILKSRQPHEKDGVSIDGLGDPVFNMRLISNPLISHRKVEPELVATLYDLSTRELDETTDVRFGNGKTTDFLLFEDSRFMMKSVKEDLVNFIKETVNSDVYIYDSFFNILGAGSGSAPHRHLNALDETVGLNLYKQKYALQYYLRVGDQDCSEPGIYKLYEPDEGILPSEGMIIIIPAARMHSAVYGGDKDRVMIGINFYAL